MLRIEDHDRQRSRPEHEAALLEDLGAARRRARRAAAATRSAAGPRRTASPTRTRSTRRRSSGCADQGLVYACDCARSTFAAYEADHGRPWRGIGCPGDCRDPVAPRGRGRGPAGGRGRGLGALAGPPGRADGRRAGRDGDLAGARPAAATGRTPSAWSSTTTRHGVDLVDPRPRPARRDARPAAARAAARPRGAAAVPAPPADPPRVRAEAVQGRRATRRSGRSWMRGGRRPSCSGSRRASPGSRRTRRRSTPRTSRRRSGCRPARP